MHLVRDSFLEIRGQREVTRVAVIGIGQSLRGDDAVGLEAIRQWREKFPETASRPEVQIEASELPGLALLDTLNKVDAAILVDAVQSFTKPGTIHRFNEEELVAFTSDSKSAHGWGVAETLQLRNRLGNAKTNIRIVGIEVEQTTIGAGLSKTVEEAIPKVCEVIEAETNDFLK
jgi:hydrogenase maturation protease